MLRLKFGGDVNEGEVNEGDGDVSPSLEGSKGGERRFGVVGGVTK